MVKTLSSVGKLSYATGADDAMMPMGSYVCGRLRMLLNNCRWLNFDK